MDNLYKHLESLWIIAVLVSVCNCSFPLQYQDSILPTGDRSLQIHGQQPGSNRHIRVICPDFVTIGVQHTLLVDVDINIINVTSRITPTNRSCLTIHRKLYTRISQGSHNFMSFTIWPSMNLYDVQTLDLSLITNNTIIYKKTLDIKYPSIYLWTSQQQFTKPDKLLLWIYSHTDTHRPVPDVNVTVTLTKADSSNDIIEKRNVTTSATGLVQLEFDSKELEVGKYSLAASHTHQTSAVSSTTVFLQPRPAVKRELKIDISTAGYHRHSRSINIKVQVWRPGVEEFEGRVKLTYCQQSAEYCRHTKIHLLGGVEYIPAEIDETVAETVHSLNISAIIIESKTGIIETIARDLDIYPHKIEVDTSNAPVQYSPGATLHIPFMVLQGQSAARHQCMLVDIITSTGILSSRRLFTDGNGEVNVHWSVSQDISGDIHIEVTDCERSQPNVISHTLTQRQQQEAESIQLYTRKYRYSVDDVMLINSFSHLHLLDILVYQCEGRILGVLHLSNHSTLNVKVTANMFPCIKLVGLEHSANLDTDNSVLLNSSLTIFIDNPNIYQINADKAKYRPGDNVVLQISSPVNQSDIRPQLAADNTFILLASPETSLTNIPKIQPKINSAYRLSSTTSSFGVEVVSPCSPNLHSDNDPNKLNLVTIATVSSTSSIVVGRRPTTPTSISQNRIRHAEGRFLNHESQLLTTTTAQPLTSPVTIPRLNWLPNGPEFRDLGLPEHWFSLGDESALQLRKRRSLHECSKQLQSQTMSEGMRCDDGKYRFQLPSYSINDWTVSGLMVSPSFGLQTFQPMRLQVLDDLYLAIKAPPSDLVEGEQFQIQISVIAPNVTELVTAHVRLLTSADEAFCFKNLILNSYPHINLTLDRDSKISLTSFTATALRRGNYTLDVELWVDGSMRDVKNIPLKVSSLIFEEEHVLTDETTPIANLSTMTSSYSDSSNLQLKMRFNKEDNQQRCKGFRLKVDHWILEASETTPSGDYEDFLFQSLGRKRRSVSLPTVTDWSAPRHSLRICYRILQKSASGSYYIDVESFTGYKAADYPLESEDDNCRITGINSESYDRGRIIMVENHAGNHSWCCFSLILESTTPYIDSGHTQHNQSASVRIHNSDSPGDFCLEFYNLHTQTPYSDHICSQHGCLCTEGALSCKRLRTQSTKKTTLSLARVYLAARYAFKVKVVVSQGQVNGYFVDEVVVEGSYGNIHLDTGQKLFIYYKKKKHCQLFGANFTYLVMGRQLHVPHNDNLSSSLYLDHQASVINLVELEMRSDYDAIKCFLESLLCSTSQSHMQSELLSNAETGQYIYTNPLYTNSSNSEEIAGIINSNCKYKKALEEDGLIETYESRFRMSEIECQADLSHVYTLQRAYQSIRRHRRHKRQRRRRARH